MSQRYYTQSSSIYRIYFWNERRDMSGCACNQIYFAACWIHTCNKIFWLYYSAAMANRNICLLQIDYKYLLQKQSDIYFKNEAKHREVYYKKGFTPIWAYSIVGLLQFVLLQYFYFQDCFISEIFTTKAFYYFLIFYYSALPAPKRYYYRRR